MNIYSFLITSVGKSFDIQRSNPARFDAEKGRTLDARTTAWNPCWFIL